MQRPPASAGRPLAGLGPQNLAIVLLVPDPVAAFGGCKRWLRALDEARGRVAAARAAASLARWLDVDAVSPEGWAAADAAKN